MKVLVIASLLFLLNLSVVVVDTLGLYSFSVATQTDWQDELSSVDNQQYLSNEVTEEVNTSLGFGDFVVALRIFIDFIWRVLNFGSTLIAFGMDGELANLLSIPVFLLYGLGVSQYIGNRGGKSME